MNKKVEKLILGGFALFVVIGWFLRIYDIEISIYPITAGAALYFAGFAFINFNGNEIFIDPKYRGSEAARAWQKGTVLPNVLLSIGSLAMGVLVWSDNKLDFPDFWMCYLLWLLIMAVLVIWLIIVNKNFYETMDKKDRPWMLR